MSVLSVVPPVLGILLEYVARGWPVLPVWGLSGAHCACPAGPRCKASPGKHPLASAVPHGVKDASLDFRVVTAWAEKFPHANWAIACGHSLESEGGYLVVLDIDPRNGGDDHLAQLEREHGELPRTVTQVSGGNGQHYLFRSREALGGAVLADGIEVKGLGGYVLVEPSRHLSGRTYAWDVGRHPDDTPIADLPTWVLETLDQRARARRPPGADGGLGLPLSTGTDAAETLLGEAFKIAGWLGDLLPEGRRQVTCPWVADHTDGRGTGTDSSTVLLPPAGDSAFGGFKCLHSHCQSHGWQDVLKALPPAALQEARARRRPRALPPPEASEPSPEAPAPPSAALSTGSPEDPHVWRSKLICKDTKNGTSVEKVVSNVICILKNDERWRGKIRYDEFADAIRVVDPPWEEDYAPKIKSEEWTDEDDTRLRAWFMRFWGLDVPLEHITGAIPVVAHASAYHEVRDYLRSLVWDGEPRIDMMLTNYFGAPADAYTRGVSGRWLVSAVARIMAPGCAVDCLPIIEGRQEIGKSKGLRALVGARWFSDSELKIGETDGYQALKGRWVFEFSELGSLRRNEVNKVKAFISAQSDHYRSSYGRHHRTHHRQCVFVGTCNPDGSGYLQDSTGNRRFWPVECERVDRAAITRDRDQIWAEAVAAYDRGTAWHVDTPDFRALCEEQQGDRYQSDPWEAFFAKWLTRVSPKTGVTTHEVLVGALDMPSHQVTKSHEMRAAVSLVQLGFKRVVRSRDAGQRVRRYYRDE